MRRVLILMVALLAVGCGGSADDGKYKQTWTQPYGQTDCREFMHDMDDHQRFVLAADYLLTLRRKDEADAPVPSDADVGRFTQALDDVCDGSTGGIASEDRPINDLAPVAYLSGDFRP